MFENIHQLTIFSQSAVFWIMTSRLHDATENKYFGCIS